MIAELSGRNPNDGPDLGLAHAIGKPIVLLTRNEEDVPFDLKALRYIYYDPNNPFWVLIFVLNLRESLDWRWITQLLPPISGASKSKPSFRLRQLNLFCRIRTESPRSTRVAWDVTWQSIKREREHKATLVIPADHGSSFTASMTITYERSGQQTIVQETLTGTFRENKLSLVGVNYTLYSTRCLCVIQP